MVLQRLSPDARSNRSLWGIAWMCFFWSLSSVMVFNILPTFLTDVLGASKKEVGWIEGFAVFCAFIAKVFAGVLSDFWKQRKPLIILGTCGSLAIKILFATAASTTWIFFAKTLDRFSKGIRSAPTDALIADLTPKKQEGTSYGVRQSLYVLGGFCGGLLASLLMYLSGNNYRLVFWLSLVPISCALVIVISVVRKAPSTSVRLLKKNYWNIRDIRYLPRSFWWLLLVTFFLMLARFSEAFLNLRGKECGWSVPSISLLMTFYDLTNALVAWPIGRLADRKNRHTLLLSGICVLTLTNIVIMCIPGFYGIALGILMAGVHLGMTQGLIASLIAEATTENLRGTAFALYYSTTGIAILIGNSVAGHLSHAFDTTLGAFGGGLVFTSISAILLYTLGKKKLVKF